MSLDKISMIIFSAKKEMIGMTVLVILAVFGLGELVVSLYSLHPDLSGRKDFTMEYLMGKALLNGVDPYLPLSELRELYPIPADPKVHPSTHPPAMALIGLPLALLPYTWAAGIWFFIELILIAISCYSLIKLWNFKNIFLVTVLITFSLFVWHPVTSEIIHGQLNSLLLFLLICAWLRLRDGRSISGGFFLGVAIAIKLLSWPIALLLLIRRCWHGFIATAATTIAINLAAMSLIGLGPLWRYYTTTSSMLVSGWSADTANFSTWSLSWRLFFGAASRGFVVDLISPIYQSATLASRISAVIPILFLVSGFYLALKMRNFDFSFGLMVCVSILFSPIAWNHYLVMAVIPVAIAIKTLTQNHGFIKIRWNIYLTTTTIGFFLIFPESSLRKLMYLFETQQSTDLRGVITHQIPFTAGLLSLVPLAALLGLIWLLWLLDKEKSFQTHPIN